jgi:ribosomal protein RSM22 (predicted rRNA methylase)
VRELSQTYNAMRAPESSLAARLAFFFARDVPKAHAALRELRALLPEKLRVLDLGAGLGAATWGVARALGRGTIEATLVDRDRSALDLALTIAKKRNHREGEVDVRIETIGADVARFSTKGADLVIAENVLTEIAASVDEDTALVLRWLDLANENGLLVIIEPAIRSRTRHLHEVRAKLIERRVAIFGPCLHTRACPMLANENDWCHEDLAVDLPPALVPLARAAGLRWQGLTFAYLVLRRDRRTLASLVPEGTFRTVSSLIRTKGKREVHLCGSNSSGIAMRLDRDESATNQAFEHLTRGDLIVVAGSAARAETPEAEGRIRVKSDDTVIDVSLEHN